MKTRDLTNGKPLHLIIAVALPLMLGNVFQQLYTVVDAQIVGMVEGVNALAALGSADWFHWLFLGIIQGLCAGFAIPVAHAFGAKDEQNLRRFVANASILAAIFAAAITALTLGTRGIVLDLLRVPEEIRPITVSYLTVIFSGYAVTMAYNLMAGILRSLGDAKTPLIAMIISSVMNIALDALFVAVFRWGVAGAAIATVIAQLAASAFCFLRLRTVKILRLERVDLRPRRTIMKHLLRMGFSISFQYAVICIGGMIVQFVVNGLGVVFIAGYTAANKLFGVLEIAALSYSDAVAPFAGQNFGAGEYDRVRRGLRSALILSVSTAGVIMALIFLFGRNLVASFISGDPERVDEALKYACEYLYLMAACLPLLYVLYVVRSTLQGIGRTLIPMISGFVELGTRISVVFLLPPIIGYYGVFCSEVAAWGGAALLVIFGYVWAVFRVLRRNNTKSKENGDLE